MRAIESMMFWTMALLGGVALSLCLVLPPWLEYQAQRERLAAADAHVLALETRLTDARKQIEHLRDDPSYVLRIARLEFGQTIDTPGTQMLIIGGEEPNAAAALKPQGAEQVDLLPELSAFLQQVISRYPHAYLFVSDQTRPSVMLLATLMLVTAIVLLGRPSGRHVVIVREIADVAEEV